MKLIITKDYEEMSLQASKIFKEEIENNPSLVLGLATGSTPIGMYEKLIEYARDGLDFSKVRSFNLDEYLGLDKDHEGSYNYFMWDNLFNHINIKSENVHIPYGNADNLEEYCLEYDKKIEDEGGIDIQLLGIGEDGHIAFNEPNKYLQVRTNIASLAPSTIEVNSRFFDRIEDVPTKAISMGMGSIMKSKKIVLLASGVKKHKVIKEFLKGDIVDPNLPVSFLLLHGDVTVIVDEAAYYGEER